jgi:CHASE3 domain sensor protein
LLANDPVKQRLTDTLTDLIAAKIIASNKQLQLNSRVPDSIRQQYVREGKLRMDDIRENAARLSADERAYIVQNKNDLNKSAKNALVLIFVLLLLTFAVLLVAYNLLERELRRRTENENQLRQYEATLQQKIQQLEVSNQELERFATN